MYLVALYLKIDGTTFETEPFAFLHGPGTWVDDQNKALRYRTISQAEADIEASVIRAKNYTALVHKLEDVPPWWGAGPSPADQSNG